MLYLKLERRKVHILINRVDRIKQKGFNMDRVNTTENLSLEASNQPTDFSKIKVYN